MNIKDVKSALEPWFMSRGFVRTSKRYIYVKDIKFCLIVAEIQPVYDTGFFINIAVKFLWHTHDILTFDYEAGNSRVYLDPPPSPTGAIMFDSPTIEQEILLTLIEADKRIKEYEELSDIKILEYELENRNDFVMRVNKDYFKKDVDRAIVKMLLNKRDEAMSVFENTAAVHDTTKALIGFCDDYDAFKRQLLKMLNERRASMSRTLNIELKSIPSISYLFE